MEERRASGRLACDIETTCHLAASAEKECIGVRVLNVSLGGIKIAVSRSFQPGELLSLALPGGEWEEVSEVLVCVVHCQFTKDHWQLGCTFATRLSEDDLARFGGPRTQPASPDHHTGGGFSSPPQASVKIVNSTEEAASCPAPVINVSARGLALQVRFPLNVGELLSVELSRGAGQPVVATLASVVRTTGKPGGDCIAHCNFIHELAEEQLRLLV